MPTQDALATASSSYPAWEQHSAAHASDMRVQVARDLYYYPDVTVSCNEIESLNAEFLMDEIYERAHFKQK